jgi:tRNA threonylcarbamoyladenosine biosynthesis protein TsaE
VRSLAERIFLAPDAEATERIAAGFSRSVPLIPERALMVHLMGELGAGKTTWARGFLAARGIARVRSPTYTLLEIYRLPGLVVAHLDLYRLTHPDEIDALGLGDLDAAEHLWLVEWPERGIARLPDADLELRLTAESSASAGDGTGGAASRRSVAARARSIAASRWLEAAEAILQQAASSLDTR